MEFLHCPRNCELLKKVCAICGVSCLTCSSLLLNCDAVLQCCGFSVFFFLLMCLHTALVVIQHNPMTIYLALHD